MKKLSLIDGANNVLFKSMHILPFFNFKKPFLVLLREIAIIKQSLLASYRIFILRNINIRSLITPLKEYLFLLILEKLRMPLEHKYYSLNVQYFLKNIAAVLTFKSRLSKSKAIVGPWAQLLQGQVPIGA